MLIYIYVKAKEIIYQLNNALFDYISVYNIDDNYLIMNLEVGGTIGSMSLVPFLNLLYRVHIQRT